MLSKSSPIAVIGGGLSGLVTSKALSMVGFKNIQLFEQHDVPHVGGNTGLILTNNCLKVFEKMRIADQLRSSGKSLGLETGPGLGIKTASLLEILKNSLNKATVTLHSGHQLWDINVRPPEEETEEEEGREEDEKSKKKGPLILEFKNKKKVPCALVIGCDGYNSLVRSLAFSEETPSLRQLPGIYIDGICQKPNNIGSLSTIDTAPALGQRFGTTFIDKDENQMYWFAAISESKVPESTRRQSTKGKNVNELPPLEITQNFNLEKLLSHLKGAFGDSSRATKILEATDPSTIRVRSLIDFQPFDWIHDRITVAGSASQIVLSFTHQQPTIDVESGTLLALHLASKRRSEAIHDYRKQAKHRFSELADEAYNEEELALRTDAVKSLWNLSRAWYNMANRDQRSSATTKQSDIFQEFSSVRFKEG